MGLWKHYYEHGRRAWRLAGLSSALAFPLDLGARPLCMEPHERLPEILVVPREKTPTGGKTIALTRHTFVDKVMSLLFNMLSRFVIAFFLRSKCLLISWLQSPSAKILEPRKIKSVTLSIFSIYLP